MTAAVTSRGGVRAQITAVTDNYCRRRLDAHDNGSVTSFQLGVTVIGRRRPLVRRREELPRPSTAHFVVNVDRVGSTVAVASSRLECNSFVDNMWQFNDLGANSRCGALVTAIAPRAAATTRDRTRCDAAETDTVCARSYFNAIALLPAPAAATLIILLLLLQVLKGTSLKNGKPVAIKCMKHVFDNVDQVRITNIYAVCYLD